MAPNQTETPEQMELSESSAGDGSQNEESLLEAKRDSLRNAIDSCCLNTIEERVAWLLNHEPKTRDSDIRLQIRYWQHFQPKHFDGDAISVTDYYRLARLTTLTRARATIQNKLKLFQASEEVKRRRKQLQEGERQNANKKRSNYHVYSVFVDESGKTQDHLIVGSLWFLNSPETFRIHTKVIEWKKSHNFESEFHFQSITEAKLPLYMAFADFIVENSALISFKAISVPNKGIRNIQTALLALTYQLLVRGVEHECATGRATLPRGLSVIKDAEEVGHDKLFVAELQDRIKQASASTFNDDLYVEHFAAIDSKGVMNLQIVDLFVSSLNRHLNATGDRKQPKDTFAEYFLKQIGYAKIVRQETVGDMIAHISL
jgi:hypothetical protein